MCAARPMMVLAVEGRAWNTSKRTSLQDGDWMMGVRILSTISWYTLPVPHTHTHTIVIIIIIIIIIIVVVVVAVVVVVVIIIMII